jgi:hypothetical protein
MKVPKFKNVKEERKFWDDHESTDYLDDFEEAKDVVFVRPKKQVISLRLEPQVINKWISLVRPQSPRRGRRPNSIASHLPIFLTSQFLSL